MEVIEKITTRKKDIDVINEIMAYKDTYYRFAYSITGNQQDSLDAIQEMYYIVYRDISKLRDKDKFYCWSMGILANCCRKIYRKNKKYIMQSFELGEVEDNYYKNIENKIDIEKYLLRINSKQRECIIMKYFMDMKQEEIANVLNISIGTVKSRIFNGLKKIKKEMER